MITLQLPECKNNFRFRLKVHTKTFNDNKKSLGVVEDKWEDIRKQHVITLMEEQDRVFMSFFAQTQGGDKSRNSTGRDLGRVSRKRSTCLKWDRLRPPKS